MRWSFILAVNCRRNLTTMLSLIYAIFIVTLGCIFTSTYHGALFSMKEYNEVRINAASLGRCMSKPWP